jgi:preprotein translocase subunit SecF
VFQFLKEPNFDFMARRNLVLGVSTAAVAASIAVLLIIGLNMGIEFTGGTELVVRYAETPDIPAIRRLLSDAGIARATVTTIGKPEEHEVNIRLGAAGDPDLETDRTADVVTALRLAADGPLAEGVKDLNFVDEAALVRMFEGDGIIGQADAVAIAREIIELRKDVALLGSHDELSALPSMTPGAMETLRERTSTGSIIVRAQSYIGPAIGDELTRKAGLAIVGSLIGMLIYIWIRFQLQWGFAAVAALAHDTIVVLGLFAIFGKEMSLPVVAAFLTLVGYSVNDTVVVFDRIRENLKKSPGKTFQDVVNLSINQTLSRTIITSGLTLFVVLALLIFGGTALNSFAFVLTAGVIVGTYSSIYVASPILVLWKRFLDNRAGREAAAGARAKKTRRRSVAG